MNENDTIVEEVVKNEETEELRSEDPVYDGGASSSEDDQMPEEDAADAPSEAEALRAEIAGLRRELEEKELRKARILAELGEFSELFPQIGINAIPQKVWESVGEGLPLAAAYALYEKRTEAKNALAQTVNQRNAERSSGAVGRDSGREYFSPGEVRKMSSAEVRKNYNIIIESMKKWN